MDPYYCEGGIAIYHGDCREILPAVSTSVDSVVTSPPYAEQRAGIELSERYCEIAAKRLAQGVLDFGASL